MNRDLVVVRAGRESLHPHWLLGGEPQFDLLVAAYEETSEVQDSSRVQTICLPGWKVHGYYRLFAQRPDLLRRYDQIGLFDDDLDCRADSINQLFSAGRRYGLELYQPSLTWDSYISYGVVLWNPFTCIRYVNFIEMMCPVFSVSMLSRALPLFSLGFETGIDRLWCRLLDDARYKYAVIDTASVHHTRPVGQRRAQQGFVDGVSDYQTVIDKVENEAGVIFRGPVAYAAILRSNKPVKGRLKMAVIALAPLISNRKPSDSSWYYRAIIDHVRHNLTRPIDNEPIHLQSVLERLSKMNDGAR